MSTIKRLRGMQDILPEDHRYWDHIIATATHLAQQTGFQRVATPILEDTELFERGNGTASDFFVQKEMYTIEEQDHSITLRPEFTAGVMRAYLENGMTNWPQPVKLFTFGPAFRRERAQAGRYRQHSQFDCEILGETDPAADAEVMLLGMRLLQSLGYEDVNFQLNSTGCPICKPKYIAALSEYLGQHLDSLAPVDQERLKRNPLRVLDSKEKGMDGLLADAPHIIDYLCEDCADHFADLRQILDLLGAPYTINFRLVRGIDYYTKTVFEVWAARIGAQSAVFGGGRYDGLAEAIGGRSTPGVGFGCGIERVVLALKSAEVDVPLPPEPAVFVAHFGGETKLAAVQLTHQLRAAGIGTRLAFTRTRRSLKSQMREANKYATRFVLILGEDEVAAQTATVRRMDGGEQQSIAWAELPTWLSAQLAPQA